MRIWAIWLLALIGSISGLAIAIIGLRKEYTRPRKRISKLIIAGLVCLGAMCFFLAKVIEGPKREAHVPTATEIADTVSVRLAGCTPEQFERVQLENSVLRVQIDEEHRRRVRSEQVVDSLCMETYRRSAQSAFENGILLFSQAEYDSAKTLFCDALEGPRLGPYTRALTLHFAGTCELQAGKPASALRYFDESIRTKPDFVPAWCNRAVALETLARNDEALYSLEVATQLDEDHEYPVAWINRAAFLDKTGNYDEALDLYDSALVFVHDDSRALVWSNRGCTLRDMARKCEALASFDSAVQLMPNFRLAWKNRASALDDLGEYEDAQRSYEIAIEISHVDAGSWQGRAKALRKQRRYLEALASYDSAVAFDHRSGSAWAGRGDALFQLRRADLAVASYDSALFRGYDKPLTWHSRGIALLCANRPTEAVASIDSALSCNQAYGTARESLVIALMAAGSYCDAVAACDSALQRAEGEERLMYTRADALLLCGRAGKAYEWIVGLLKEGHDDPAVELRFGFASLALSQYCQALSIADHGLAWDPNSAFESLRSLVLDLMPKDHQEDGARSALRLRSDEAALEAFYTVMMKALISESVLQIVIEG